MATHRRRQLWLTIAGVFVALGVAGAITLAVINPSITRYVEGPGFRAELEKQTAKGLHFSSSKFGPIRRTGFLSAATDTFEAEEGRKAMTSLHAHGITARFNPLGVFLRRWQLDELHIDGGEVGIQVYEPKPEPTPAKPWYHVFLPDRVYLKRVWSEPADVTWKLRGGKSGIFGTRLLITPHGRDFEYQGTGGTMKNAGIPDLPLRHAHMLITKTLFELYQLELTSGDGIIQGEGTAETRGEKRIDFKVKWDKLPLREWLPKSWEGDFAGTAAGDLRWTGNDFKLETATMRGALRVSGARMSGLGFLKQLAAVTKRKDFERLELNECAADLVWDKGKGGLKNIVIEDEGKFRIKGTVSVSEQSLGGTIQLGLGREYLAWMPNPEEVFPRAEGGYLWATVHLSGTLAEPQQDLSPRLVEAMKESPTAFFGAAFRALGAWLRGK